MVFRTVKRGKGGTKTDIDESC